MSVVSSCKWHLKWHLLKSMKISVTNPLEKEKGGIFWSPDHACFHGQNPILNDRFSLLSCSMNSGRYKWDFIYCFENMILASSMIPQCVCDFRIFGMAVAANWCDFFTQIIKHYSRARNEPIGVTLVKRGQAREFMLGFSLCVDLLLSVEN